MTIKRRDLPMPPLPLDSPPMLPPIRRRSAAPRLGMLSGAALERLLVALVHVGAWLFIVLSVIGTFYGARGESVPLTAPWALLRAMMDVWPLTLLAAGGQSVLSLLQWGGRQMARQDRRWWLCYLAALALSAWWNWTAYGTPLIALGVPWLLAASMIIAGDIFPEIVLVRMSERDE